MSGLDPPHDPLESLCIHRLYGSSNVSVYDVRCRPHDKRRGREEQPLTNQIVFPRRGVFEFASRGETVIADANRILFFNRDDGYHVAHPAGSGDDCTVFAFDSRLLRVALEAADPRWLDAEIGRAAGSPGVETGVASRETDRLGRPFRFAHGLSDERTFLAHERLRRAVHARHPEALAVDESAIELLSAALETVCRAHRLPGNAVRASTRGAHEEIVQRVSLYLATTFCEDGSLEDVARAVHSSPFHLSRLFRRKLGLTIHQYRHRLRLRAALAHIADGERDLSALALDLGFSSHSHLSDAFRLAFGKSPTECRKTLNLRRYREMSRILEAKPGTKL